MKTCGIYRIINTVNHKTYIGQSTNIEDRFIRHRYQLKNNIHGNIKYQTHQEIADKYSVSRSVITRIKNGNRWGLITNIKGENI
jgi:hypothetical protein